MLTATLVIALLLVAFWTIARFYLQGEDLSRYDRPAAPPIGGVREPSTEHHEVLELLGTLAAAGEKGNGRNRLKAMREAMDAMGDEADLTGITVTPVDADGVSCEWVTAERSEPGRRLLYLHGGAFSLGSPRSHRPITSRLARTTGVSVLAVDYRLVPENRRIDCLTDCQTAYRWILGNGPGAGGPPDVLFVAGDSAGGNLTLSIIAWARDAGLRAANGAIALSPLTDASFESPSLSTNVATDRMLGPVFGRITRLPRSVLAWFTWLTNRVHPCDPRISPLRGELDNLPPTLIHASEAEMLLDDARRYVHKATEAGSEATLETWCHMIHVWQLFEQRLPEAREAFDHIGRFMALIAPMEQADPSVGRQVDSGHA